MRDKKEKPPEINDFRGSLVAEVVLLGLRLREYHFGGALLQEAHTRFARIVLFIPQPLQKQAFDAPGNKKPGELSSTGLLVVAGVGLSKGLKYLIIR